MRNLIPPHQVILPRYIIVNNFSSISAYITINRKATSNDCFLVIQSTFEICKIMLLFNLRLAPAMYNLPLCSAFGTGCFIFVCQVCSKDNILTASAADSFLLIFTVRHHEKISGSRSYLIKIAFHIIANASGKVTQEVQKIFVLRQLFTSGRIAIRNLLLYLFAIHSRHLFRKNHQD